MEENGKTIAIISHITLIGWIVGVIMNSSKKDEFASFYTRQMLGLLIIWFISGIVMRMPVIGVIGWVVGIGVFAFWILSLIAAVNGKKEPTPFIGQYFQMWFKAL